MGNRVTTGKQERTSPVGAGLPAHAAHRAALESAILTWELSAEEPVRALGDAHFLGVFSYHLVQLFGAEEALHACAWGRSGHLHRQAHRSLASHLRKVLEAAAASRDTTLAIRVLIQAWREHQAGPLHAREAPRPEAPQRSIPSSSCA